MTSRSIKVVATAAPRTPTPLAVVDGLRQSGVWARARAYVALTKPGIIWLLLVTTVPAMIMAAGGWPGLDKIALVLLGGTLTAGGANVLNQWYDRDIDAVMARTAARPLPTGEVAPGSALVWGLLLIVLGVVELALALNWLTAVWAMVAAAFYVVAYTMVLKRRTAQNIVIGGAAGAVPALVGWAAVTESVGWAPAALFLIVFLWTPPHFWALALRYRDDYARAAVPMLPVVAGEAATRQHIFWYTVALVATTALLPVIGEAGWFYAAAAAILGLGFLVQAWRVWRAALPPMALFFFSIVYLPLLFAAAAIDEFVA